MTTQIQLSVTRAGREALVNAQRDGTNAVRIATCGVTATSFTAGPDTATLPGEIKRIATIAGSATSDVTMHVTVRDEGSDAYTVRGFAFYLDNGVLFGSYGQPDPILQKTAASVMLLALDAVFAELDTAQLVFGDVSFVDPAATAERAGVVELATDAETITGADELLAVTPKGLLAALNERIGAGAPSVFMKGLLPLATAVLLRAAIGLGSAAVKDTGAGNGLDADLLDNQDGSYYRAWANLTGVPAFASRWPTFDEVQNKPATYPPSVHPHAISDVGGLQAALDALSAGKINYSDFTGSFGENGWCRMPNGLIFQWGVYRSPTPWQEGTGPTLSFPIAFPNACLNLQTSTINNNVGNQGWIHYDIYQQETSVSQSGFSTFLQWPGSDTANYWCGCRYFAVGY